jgi:outer membrane murein-binding lipoprotein Lpp
MKIFLPLTEIQIGIAGASLLAMTFTPSELTAITIASGALVATIFAGVVNIITALRSERKIDHAIIRVDDVSAKADVITGHVNSAASASAAKIDKMQATIDTLTNLLADSKQTAAVLAQSTADVAVLKPIAQVVELAPARSAT